MVQKNSATSPASPVRGRPRSFDTDEVLGQVRNTFWRYGYAGTSMDQLSAATGLHKPSLYGAFGDKKRLYLAALDNYLAEVRAQFADAFAVPDLSDSLYAMSEWSIDKFVRSDEGSGCFMMTTAMPEAAEDPEISRVVREAMESLERAMVKRFDKAIADGQISPQADSHTLAMIMVANHYELSARARAGYSRAELRMLADRALAVVRSIAGLTSDRSARH